MSREQAETHRRSGQEGPLEAMKAGQDDLDGYMAESSKQVGGDASRGRARRHQFLSVAFDSKAGFALEQEA